MSPQKLHRVAAIVEMCTWALLIIGMIAKYSGATEALMPIFGGIHGFGFLCFVVMTVLVWANDRWGFGLGVLGLVVSVIPFAALPFALWADKKGMLSHHWRFSDPAEQPQGVVDSVLALVVRKPVLSVLGALIVIAVVFSILLYLGPPVDVESIIRS